MGSNVSEFKFNFAHQLAKGVFEGRFKRFFAQIQTSEGLLTAHLPNTGSLKGVNIKGMPCLYSKSDDPNRKLAYTLEAIQSEGGAWVGVNTQTPNRVIKQVLFDKYWPAWAKYKYFKPEYSISKETRFDFALSDSEFPTNQKGKAALQRTSALSNHIHLIEVKNVTLMEIRNSKRVALFPDSVTERGQKHLRELAEMSEKGFTSEIVYFIQRSDVDDFDVAEEIDHEYAQIYRSVTQAQVQVTIVHCDFQPEGLSLRFNQFSKI